MAAGLIARWEACDQKGKRVLNMPSFHKKKEIEK